MNNNQLRHQPRHAESGSALVYILIAIALLAALTVSFMQPSGNQTQSQNTFKTVSELQSQIDFIRAAVHECVLSHPGGDINIDNTAASANATDVGADKRYPIDPSSTYFTGATIGPAAENFARNIRCPGNPGDDQNHAVIFGGATGKFLPPPPPLFEDWRWYNGAGGIFFWVSSENSDAFITEAYDRLEESFAACEADQIVGQADLDEDGVAECEAGHRCLRVWMVMDTVDGAGDPEDGAADTDTSLYPDEAACNTP
ncbi:MAG: hypothetical protein KJ667_06660 [Alphaproteobacteria bacterium]|nr:hypothetical protein [Alphaproteobacteria bacterium]